MYPRHRTQLEEFSTFVEFNSEPDSPPVRWRSDVRLSKNIIKLLESEDYKGVSTKVIALTFVKKIQEQYDTLIHRHLVAYLQKCCFKTCYSIYRDLKKNFPENLELEQLFLEANSFLLEKDIFDRYDFQSSAIETHITGIVKNKLLDSISKSLGDSSRRSIWGLLNRQVKQK